MSVKMVRLHQVGKQYSSGRYALKNISFDLQSGEFAYVTGSNGAGKTTLLKLLFAMEKASEGSVFVCDRDLTSLNKNKVSQYRREIGFVFQDFKLLPDVTIWENISLPLEVQSSPKHEIEYRVQAVLSLIGLSDRAKDFPSSLSGGEQQRVVIARSIVGKPSLLLADEPTGNLDSQTARDIMALFREIHDMGTTVLIATHDEILMQEYPARVLQLDKGQLVSDESSQQGGRS